jgi:hypothetical protein
MAESKHPNPIDPFEPFADAVEAYLRFQESQRAANTPKSMIWAGLGLILVLFYAFLLTTHWFGT